MPQIFQVLRCYKCSVFQVHQTKKSNKFQCKLCGEKQSIKRHYGIGTAKDCRTHVQKLNGIQGEIENHFEENHEEEHSEEENIASSKVEQIKESKWSDYVDKIEEEKETNDEEMCINDVKVVLEVTQKRKNPNNYYKHKRSKPHSYYNKHSKNSYTNQSDEDDDEIMLKVNTDHPKPEFNSMLKLNENTPKPKKFIPPIINKNSKWAHFAVDEDEINKENCSYNSEEDAENIIVNDLTDYDTNLNIEQPQNNLFSQCDDSQLDDLLNI